jgi:hypothetical protein
VKVSIVRKGKTRVDFERGELIIRKPRVAKPSDDLSAFAYAQAKIDGMHVVVARDLTQGIPSVFTTQGTVLNDMYGRQLTHCDWLWEKLVSIPPWRFVEGELYVPGQGRESVKTALKETPELLRLAVFGFDGETELSLDGLSDWCSAWGLECAPFTANGKVLDAGDRACDGVVYKESMYGDWVKVKDKRTIDLVVTRVKMGVGKYWNSCGSLTGAVEGIEVCDCSGMDDAVRAEVGFPGTHAIGRVFEVEYERVGSQGRLQHPRFKCWRDDKAASDCTLDQDFKLQTRRAER